MGRYELPWNLKKKRTPLAEADNGPVMGQDTNLTLQSGDNLQKNGKLSPQFLQCESISEYCSTQHQSTLLINNQKPQLNSMWKILREYILYDSKTSHIYKKCDTIYCTTLHMFVNRGRLLSLFMFGDLKNVHQFVISKLK
ncbi:unnamed protein product [Owenia fusiformis]|uniref:Uncharacterized protein n=1 Tax=Owenia fusiformis TaxID=6347 RepID=A0A8J1TNQ7_OWEFU|nr:unnamed protein product [Owenia fusiformis]